MKQWDEDSYMARQLDDYNAKGDRADARKEAIEEVSEDLQAAELAKCATVTSITKDNGQFMYYRSSLQEFIGEIDSIKMAALGKFVKDGDIFGTGQLLIELVKEQIKKESDYLAEDQVDSREEDDGDRA